jgi:polysaccharide deacetylase family protein (PEP-CTERM system associated)
VVPHGLSFDVEDWHQLAELRLGETTGPPSALFDDCMDRILDLCDELGIKATFFVLGLVAKYRPRLVREISARGHEVASHSITHKLLHRHAPGELLSELRDAKRMLEDQAGQPVLGFRAPEFSVQRLDSPCFHAIREAGFIYDSSVFPVSGIRYGIADAPRAPFVIETPAGPLLELPLATLEFGGIRLPTAGGSYYRLLPSSFLAWAARRATEPQVFYFHPYEFSTRPLYLDGGWSRNRAIGKLVLLHNFATSRIERSIRILHRSISFGPLRELTIAS